jgi:hypothetical protein
VRANHNEIGLPFYGAVYDLFCNLTASYFGTDDDTRLEGAYLSGNQGKMLFGAVMSLTKFKLCSFSNLSA